MSVETGRRRGRPPTRECGECGDCAKCRKATYAREWYRRKTPEERREYVARRNKELARANDRKRYREQPHRQDPASRRDPKRRQASRMVSNAILSGRMAKPDECEECGATPPPHLLDAHHKDYDRPLEVEWLCRECHGKRHTLPDEELVGPQT